MLLIADHHPFAGAADSLAYALGVFFANGFALPPPYKPHPVTGEIPPIVFRRGKGLTRHPVLDGRSRAERIDSGASFTGSAFWLGSVSHGREVMRLPGGTQVLLPVVAWQFSDSTPRILARACCRGRRSGVVAGASPCSAKLRCSQ